MRLITAKDVLSFFFKCCICTMCIFQLISGSSITPRNLTSVTSLISFWPMCTAFLHFSAAICFVDKYFGFGGKYIKQLLSKLICRRFSSMYSLIWVKVVFVNWVACSRGSLAMKIFISSAYEIIVHSVFLMTL